MYDFVYLQYRCGRLTRAQLDRYVVIGWITAEQRQSIIGAGQVTR